MVEPADAEPAEMEGQQYHAISYKGLEHPDVGICRGPGINLQQTPRDDCVLKRY